MFILGTHRTWSWNIILRKINSSWCPPSNSTTSLGWISSYLTCSKHSYWSWWTLLIFPNCLGTLSPWLHCTVSRIILMLLNVWILIIFFNCFVNLCWMLWILSFLLLLSFQKSFRLFLVKSYMCCRRVYIWRGSRSCKGFLAFWNVPLSRSWSKSPQTMLALYIIIISSWYWW